MPFAYSLSAAHCDLFWKPVGAPYEVTTIYCNNVHVFFSAQNVSNSLLREENSPVSVSFPPCDEYVTVRTRTGHHSWQITRYDGECESLRALLLQMQTDLNDIRNQKGDFEEHKSCTTVFRRTDDWNSGGETAESP